jgi:transcriptional regulator with XRE-family HTH domain
MIPIDDTEKAPSRVKIAREAIGLSQFKLAEMVGCSQQTIDHIERGRVQVSRYTHKIEQILKLRRDDESPSLLPLQLPPPQLVQLPLTRPAAIPNASPHLNIAAQYQEVRPELPFYKAIAQEGMATVIAPAPEQVQHYTLGDYWLQVYSDLMRPAYSRGDLIIVDAHKLWKVGHDVVLSQGLLRQAPDSQKVIIAHLVSCDDNNWEVEFYQKHRRECVSRTEYPNCSRIKAVYRE